MASPGNQRCANCIGTFVPYNNWVRLTVWNYWALKSTEPVVAVCCRLIACPQSDSIRNCRQTRRWYNWTAWILGNEATAAAASNPACLRYAHNRLTLFNTVVRHDICWHSYAVERGLVVGFCAQPHYCYRPYYPTARFPSPSSYMVSDEPFPDRAKAHVLLTCTNGSRPITFLWLWPATDHEPHCRHVSINKIWRWTESTPWSRWWRSHMAGIYSDCSTREINTVAITTALNNTWQSPTSDCDLLVSFLPGKHGVIHKTGSTQLYRNAARGGPSHDHR